MKTIYYLCICCGAVISTCASYCKTYTSYVLILGLSLLILGIYKIQLEVPSRKVKKALEIREYKNNEDDEV